MVSNKGKNKQNIEYEQFSFDVSSFTIIVLSLYLCWILSYRLCYFWLDKLILVIDSWGFWVKSRKAIVFIVFPVLSWIIANFAKKYYYEETVWTGLKTFLLLFLLIIFVLTLCAII